MKRISSLYNFALIKRKKKKKERKKKKGDKVIGTWTFLLKN